MKICFTVDSMNSGGAERVVSTLANEFASNGHEVTIVMVSTNRKESFYNLKPTIALFALLDGCSKKPRFFGRSKLLKKILIKIQPDVVISFLPHICIYSYFALKNTNIRFICSERNDPNKYGFLKKALSKYVFKKADGCVFQTNDALRFYFPKQNNHAVVINNPLLLQTSPVSFNCVRNKVILSVGRLEEQKNHKMLIEAFDSISDNYPEYCLKIYGTGSLENSLREYISSIKSKNNIYLMGNSKTWQIDEKEAALFVLSSNFEGMPNALMEAMALGIPCISTNCPIGGPSKLIINGENGFLINVNSKDQLIDNMCKVLNRPEIAVSFAKKNRKMIENFSSQTIANEWLLFVKKIMTFSIK